MKTFMIIMGFIFTAFNLAGQNVGIGTTTPSKPLDVALPGGIQISRTENGSTNNEIFFSDNGQIRSLDDNHRIVFNRSNDQLEFNELGKILFITGNPLTEAMRINGNGYIGIGTTLPLTPNNLLSVAGGITIDYNNQNNGTIANVLSFGSSGGEGIGSARLAFPLPVNSHGLDFYTNYTKRMSIDAGGNVGIGTTTPAAKLDVEGNVKIADGTQADGKVLTSDADGNAYWKGVVACSVSKQGSLTANDTLPNGFRDIIFYTESYDEGGNNYDPSTGLFTAPVTGIYNCSTNILLSRFSGSSSFSGAINLVVMVNSTQQGFLNLYKAEDYVQVVFSTDIKLNAGDTMNIRLYNITADKYEIANYKTSNMNVHLVK